MRAPLAVVAADRPPVGRGEAAEAARNELRHAIYSDDRSWLDRLFERVGRWFGDNLGGASTPGASGLNWPALVAVVLVLGALIGAIVWQAGRVRRNTARAEVLDFERTMTADEHRAQADRFAAAEAWREAVRERLRAMVRELEQRGLLDERPGRTADEIARQAAAVVPDVAADLTASTRVFADVWYGDRAAGPATDAGMRATDERLRQALRQRAGAR